MVKKTLNKIISAVCVLIIIVSLLLLMLVLMSRFTGTNNVMGYSAFRVMTDSMVPAIPVDSFVLVKQVAPEEIKKGDIISFYSNDPQLGGAVNTHRVDSVSVSENGRIAYITKGDNNLIEDKYMVYTDDLIGRVIFISHGLGVAVRLLSNPLVFVPLILIPLLFIFISNIKAALGAVKELSAAEEEILQNRLTIDEEEEDAQSE